MNVQELQLVHFNISICMPYIQECFGHFAPAVQKLDLLTPKGSCCQIVYFIGLFPNLQDLTLRYPMHPEEEGGVLDSTLIPHFKPPLHGSFTLSGNEGEALVREMIKYLMDSTFTI